MKSVMLTSASVLTLLVTLALSGCGGASGVTTTPPPPPSPPPQPLAITSFAPPSGSVQNAYGGAGTGFSLAASGGVTPYAWSWTATPGSSLPSGLSLSAGGQISGTPTTAGTYNVAVTVADSQSPPARTSTNYSILIAAAGQLVITSGAPPNGTVNQTYGGSHTITQNNCSLNFSGWPLSAAGGTAGYNWNWAAAPGSSLPPGLAVSLASNTCGGTTRCCVTVSATVIGGTPTAAGTYHVIVTLTDSASPPAQASANYTITITGATAAAAAKATAQVPSAQQFAHYALIDLGTLGGPQSYVSIPPSYAPVLNDQGTVAGWADTLISDPYPSFFCFNSDCFVSKAFRWQNGTQTELKGLAKGLSSQANWISPNGLIAGISQNGQTDPLFPGFPESRAVLWKNGEIIDLGTLPKGGFESAALAVNSLGQVVGAAANEISDSAAIFGLNFGWITQTRAFLWQNGVMQDLGTLGGTDAVATLINEQGQIVGESYIGSSPSAYCAANIGFPLTTGAFLWENGKMTDLGNFGGSCTFASDLNNRGQVIGLSTLPGDTAQHPFLWDHGVLTDLGTLGGKNGFGDALNDAGDVVGWASLPGDQNFHASLWKANTHTMTDLGTVDGDPCSIGTAVNLALQVVGQSVPACDFSQARAFLWEDGSILDLNALVPPSSKLYLTFPETINDRGEIAGVGFDLLSGNQHAFLLIPCDENHPRIEGCDYTPVDAGALATSSIPPLAPQRPRSANAGLPLPARPTMRATLNRLRPRYRTPGAEPPR